MEVAYGSWIPLTLASPLFCWLAGALFEISLHLPMPLAVLCDL